MASINENQNALSLNLRESLGELIGADGRSLHVGQVGINRHQDAVFSARVANECAVAREEDAGSVIGASASRQLNQTIKNGYPRGLTVQQGYYICGLIAAVTRRRQSGCDISNVVQDCTRQGVDVLVV